MQKEFRVKDFAIINAWGCNRGSEAMHSAICSYLNQHCPDLDITIYARDWIDLSRFKNVQVKPMIKIQNLCPNESKSKQEELRDQYVKDPSLLSQLVDNIFNHDLVISSPEYPYLGDLFPEDEIESLLNLALCKAKNIPFGILANSAGPFNNPERKEIRLNLFKDALFWTVREDLSFNYVKNFVAGTEFPNHLGADVAFAHPDRSPADFLPPWQNKDFYQALEFINSKPTIVVTLTDSDGYRRLDMTQELLKPSTYLSKVGRFLKHIVEKTGCQLMIFPHFYGKLEEQQVIQTVIEESGILSGISVLNPLLHTEAHLYLYKAAEFAVTFRYHPLVFAARSSCPFMAVSYQYKFDGVLKFFEDPCPVVTPFDSLDSWIQAFAVCWDNRDVTRQQIKNKLPSVLTSSRKHLDILLDVIKEGCD
jgi:polysaccharide pyruvyl transferase WcaK-like protein